MKHALVQRLRQLPTEARDRHNRFLAAAVLEAVALEGNTTRQMEIIAQLQQAKSRLREANAAGQFVRPTTHIDDEGNHVAGWRRDDSTLAAAEADVERLQNELDALRNAMRSGSHPPDTDEIGLWVQRQPSGTVWRMKPITLKLAPGETPEQRLPLIGDELSEFYQQLNDADLAPLPTSDALKAFQTAISGLADAAKPDFSGLFRVDKKGRQGKASFKRTFIGLGKEDALDAHLMFWAFKDQFIARCKAEITAQGKLTADTAMTLADREARKKDTREAIRELHFIEQWLIDQVERKTGRLQPRRRGVPVDALLGIEPDPDADFG